jgi:hypothetical protein
VVARRARIIQGRGNMSDHIPRVPAAIVVDRPQHVQRRQSPVDEATKGVHLRGFTGQELTYGGLRLMHGSRRTAALQSQRHQSDGLIHSMRFTPMPKYRRRGRRSAGWRQKVFRPGTEQHFRAGQSLDVPPAPLVELRSTASSGPRLSIAALAASMRRWVRREARTRIEPSRRELTTVQYFIARAPSGSSSRRRRRSRRGAMRHTAGPTT